MRHSLTGFLRQAPLGRALFAGLALCAGCLAQDDEQEWGLSEELGPWRAPSSAPGVDAASRASDFFEVVAPRGVARKKLALAAMGSLEIGSAARVVRQGQERSAASVAVVTMGSLSVGARARVGSIYSLGSAAPRLDPDAFIDGYVRSAAPLAKPAPHVRLGVLDREQPGTAQVFRWRVPAEGSADQVARAEAGNPLALAVGSYRDVRVADGATLRLAGGQHAFASLELPKRAILELDNRAGPVFVWVHHKLSLAGHVVHHSPVRNVVWGYGGEEPLRITRDFRGVLVAPRASVYLSKTDAPHAGSIFADAITLEGGAVFEQEAFLDLTSDPETQQDGCYQCSLEASEVARECCRVQAARTDDVGDANLCSSQLAGAFEACERRRDLLAGRCNRAHAQRTLRSCEP